MVDYEEELDRYLDEIKELARSKQYARLRDLFLPMEPADIALLLEESGGELMPLLYRLLPKRPPSLLLPRRRSKSRATSTFRSRPSCRRCCSRR